MVSNWWMRQMQGCRATIRLQSKIYGEPKQPVFSRFFAELSRPQSLAIYRQSLGEKPMAAAAAGGFQGRGGAATMLFLLRMAFWLGLVLVLLPRDRTPESEKLPQISVGDAVQAATAAVSDMGQFCKRQPQACEVGGQAATVIGVRAQDGARKVYRSVTDKKPDDKKSEADRKSPDHTGSIGVAANDDPELSETAPRDTLTPDDLSADWHLPPTP
jgi:hypothetical protein